MTDNLFRILIWHNFITNILEFTIDLIWLTEAIYTEMKIRNKLFGKSSIKLYCTVFQRNNI